MNTKFEMSQLDLDAVLRQHHIRKNTDELAKIFDRLDLDEIEQKVSLAMESDDDDPDMLQTDIMYEEVGRQLRELGIIRPRPSRTGFFRFMIRFFHANPSTTTFHIDVTRDMLTCLGEELQNSRNYPIVKFCEMIHKCLEQSNQAKF